MPAFRPEVIAAYKQALALHRDSMSAHYEPGKRQAYQAACVKLHALLGREPWAADLFDTIDSDQPPIWMTDNIQIASWLSARFLFEQLDAS